MNTPKRTLLALAFSTLVSCSSPPQPANTPMIQTSPPPLRLYATMSTLPLLNDLTANYGDPNVSFETRAANLQSVLTLLIEGETPYILTNYLPSEIPLWAAPIAQDALVMVVHPDIGLDNLTLDQLRDLYQGRITSWQHLGGAEQSVTLVTREDGSGMLRQFETQVMGMRRISRTAVLASSSAAVLETVAQTPGAIGFVSQAEVSGTVRILSIEGAAPTRENIEISRYPLRYTIYLAGLEAPQGLYETFFTWMQSPQGQVHVNKKYFSLLLEPKK